MARPHFLAPPRLKIGPSHVAVLCEFHGSMVWIESTTLCKHPCAILGYQVDGCQAHLPEDRIRDYITTGGHVDLYRLSPIDRLSPVRVGTADDASWSDTSSAGG